MSESMAQLALLCDMLARKLDELEKRVDRIDQLSQSKRRGLNMGIVLKCDTCGSEVEVYTVDDDISIYCKKCGHKMLNWKMKIAPSI